MTASRPATLVFLVRHGTTPTTGAVLPGRAPGLHLSAKGKQQAESVGERLKRWMQPQGPEDALPVDPGDGRNQDPKSGSARPRRVRVSGKGRATAKRSIAGVYASPLERTRETAAPIASAVGSRIRTDRGLLECDFGEWTGGSLKELAKKPEWATVQRYPSGFRFPGGESFSEMQTRIVETLHRICDRHPGEVVVAVSHADPIKAAVADAIGTHLDLFQRIAISPCSITAISYGPAGPSVLAVNSTGTLSELMPS